MNFQRRLRRLNEQFAKFGRNPQGETKYRWASTADLVYYIEKGYGEKPYGADWLIPEGYKVYRPTYRYERHHWSETPLGLRWVMSVWEPPIPLDDWLKKVGVAFPWPHLGEYKAIDNMCLEPGEEPNEFWTAHAVLALEIELGMTPASAAEEVLARYKKQERSVRQQIKDDLEDTLTAFGKIPGSHDSSVSLPTPQRLIVASGGTPIEQTSGEQSGN